MRHSNFFITLNTNQRFNELSKEYEDYRDKFRKCIDQLFSKDNLHNLFKFKEEDKSFGSKTIKSINIDKVVELGEENKCIHLHALISVSQYTPIHLNYTYITDFVKQKMGLENVYFNNKVFRDNKLTLLDYINKGKKK